MAGGFQTAAGKLQLPDCLTIIIERTNEMATADYHSDKYVRQLNDWHLQLAIAQEAMSYSVNQLQDIPEGLLNTLGILDDRLLHLVESCPFPPAIGGAPACGEEPTADRQ